MRDLGSRIIREQFHRIANGGAKLTPFDISYKLPGQVGTDYQLEFHVVPDSNPPTNIHVLIGRNGVGKTHMLTSMIRCLSTGNQDGQYGKFSFEHRTKFSNFVCVAFSPFDTYPMPDDIEEDEYSGKYTYIGLGSGQEIRMQRLEEQFIAALRSCNKYKEKRTLWIATMTLLNSEEEPLHPYFDDVEQDIWLSVRFEVAGKELVPTYFVRKPVAWNDLLFRRVENHMVLYNLYTSYAVHAAEEITGRSGIWHVFLDRCGEDFLAASFHDEAVSREQLFLNSWQSALYRGLEEHIDFVTQWLRL